MFVAQSVGSVNANNQLFSTNGTEHNTISCHCYSILNGWFRCTTCRVLSAHRLAELFFDPHPCSSCDAMRLFNVIGSLNSLALSRHMMKMESSIALRDSLFSASIHISCQLVKFVEILFAVFRGFAAQKFLVHPEKCTENPSILR